MKLISDKIVLSMYGAQPVAENTHLYQLVSRLANEADIPMPKVYIINEAQPNAFATGRNPSHAAVAVTRGLMDIVDDNELSGVIGHELGHVHNRDILISTVAATMAGAITFLANMARWAAIFGGGRRDDDRDGGNPLALILVAVLAPIAAMLVQAITFLANMARWAAIFGGGRRDDDRDGGNPLALILVAVLAPIAAMLVQMAISRTREYKADEFGARVSGNPLYLANALRKLESYSRRIPMPNASPATENMFTREYKADEFGARVSGNPLYLANALRKLESYSRRIPMPNASPATENMFIVSPLAGNKLANLFSTHPATADRIKKLEEMSF